MKYQEYNLHKTSKRTAEIGDVVLQSRKKIGARTRQILSARIIDNSVDQNDSLNMSLIHQKAKEGIFDTNYEDLRKLEPGVSVCIKLDTLQTKHLYNLLKDYYAISQQGASSGKRFIVSGVNDISQIHIENSKAKIEFIKKLFSSVSDDDLKSLLADPEAIKNVFTTLPRIRIDILENLKVELENQLNYNEKMIQNWIDQQPKIRCLIFGLEYVDYKREVQFGNSQFDILTEQSGTDHVIIEMKSPNADVFKFKQTQLKNGVKTDYILSGDLAEAIPQTIKYLREYERSNSEDFQRVGVERKIPHKALIIIGRKRVDQVWQQHYNDLNHRISGIEILTYDHLIEKMSNQIQNLKNLI